MAASTALQVFVSPLLGTLYDNLSPLILEKIGLVWGVTKEMAKVSDILFTIRDVLEDAEDKQITNKLISNWLRKLKDVAYDVEDLLDECATEAFGPQSRIIERATVAERIKSLINKFEEIAEERSRFHLINLTSKIRDAHSHTGVSLQRETSSFPTESQVYGREKEKNKIVSLLVNNVAEGISICNIVGMGGLGKTTLAKMIHNDERIVSHFQVRCWVCASKSFELKTLISAIMESLTGNAHHVQYLDTLLHRIQEILSGKRFLLVLDDVWNEDQAKWDALKSSLTCGANGSSIIVTTRLKTVASLVSNLYVCNPDFLSDKDCFSLFKHRAFVEGEGDSHPNLLSIGKEIVKKCGGLPLAAKALGGLLRFKREEQEWLFVRDSNIWDLPQDQEEAVLPALRLSYNFLPSQLRQCFAYCSIFPKDYEMKKQVLIHLWMANGFVQPKGSMALEDVGNEIFNDLLWRSFFQDVYKDMDGNIAGCKMHDLVHDLACSITGNECCSIMDVGKEEIVGTSITRHLSIPDSCFSQSSSTDLGSFLSESQPILRTFLRLDHKLHVHVPPQLSFSNLTCLRVLDLSETQVTTLPASLGLLKHLRYLDLSKTYITSLPNEIFCNLRNLQTLKLFGCNQLQMLPENLQNISNLRHLDITKCNKLTRMPVRMGQLKCLQTLSIFIVGKAIGRGIEELQGLDLRGELTIKLLKNVRNPINAKNANLIRKKNLCSLRLCWSNESLFEEINYSTEEDDEVIAESLQPHPNIKWLHLSFYNGVKFPSWMRNFTCLPSLVEISLDGCKRCEHLPPLGQLPHLKVLKMSGMNSLKCIGDEFYYGENDNMRRKRGLLLFPSLEELELRQMPHLEEWKGWSSSTSSASSSTSEEKKEEAEVLAFPILKSLDIYGCPKLRTCYPLPLSIQRLSLWGCRDVILTISLERLHQLSRLSSLTIGGFDELMSFPDEGVVLRKLNALKLLEIGFCPKLKTITTVLMENFTALTYLRIWGCQELIYLPDGMQNLTSLQSLNIYSCHGLKSLSKGLQHFPILNTLLISDCPELEFLPDDFQHLVSLRHLKLGKLDKMTFLPVVRSQYPTGTLESIDIWCCRNLKFLPDGLKDLNTLESLEIRDCHPDLHVRCQKTTGEDWHKISHVPTIRINLEIVNGA